ncbi:MAG TPA: Gfo/Idh/MocA family oxidoreductase [Candidatus Binataceae bacterium]|jgi:myo-inositol 2-dehydrogenase/D-chiro-inositol 1-dehydrogenase|nr:Gfo/Idh/MocA family oxidoreductase [Candidatus Binataceae bacterium]
MATSDDDAILRFAVVGTGMMGVEHIRNLKLRPDVQVVALCDPVQKSLEKAMSVLGEHASRPDCFSDVASLLAARNSGLKVDAVVVASPNHTHREVLEPLLGTGLHILCEKPLATTLDDARWTADAANVKPRGVFWVGMEYRYMPPVAEFIARVKSGAIGELRMVAIREHRFPFLPKVGDWNRFSRNTGGTMVEKCCHFFDLMRLIVGAEPVRIFCSGAMDVNHWEERYGGETPDIIDNSYTIVDFANGVRGMLDLCMFAEGSQNEQEIAAVGDRAKLEVLIPEGDIVFSPRVGFAAKRVEREHVEIDQKILRAGYHCGATYFQHGALIGAIRGRNTTEVTANDGLMAVAMGLAAERSAREKRAIELDTSSASR